ncbi:hypothetical protein ACFVYA_17900 [Amycolatopsis sp. NPDC058278]|uniref:hypothetical protein n=1 Tax=Amycolatopsis sp. NPDC058278 TaxID=3346417 RepID=UPI0036DA5370
MLYSCFTGNVSIQAGNVDLSANFGWIPLLSFANNIDLMVERLVLGEVKVYHFTESDDWISLSEQEAGIKMECSYLPGTVGFVGREDVRKGVRLASLTLVDCIERKYPEIGSNAVFLDIASRMRSE